MTDPKNMRALAQNIRDWMFRPEGERPRSELQIRDNGMAAANALDEAAAEIERLSEILTGIEMLTATGEGLDAEQTIIIHLIAAEGRADDPAAWRADPAVIERLRSAVRAEEASANA
ncbi:hypothetical protein LCM08_04015 [Salipiger pacificus]|nr:hypothetical protein [Alloyangia pacifica]